MLLHFADDLHVVTDVTIGHEADDAHVIRSVGRIHRSLDRLHHFRATAALPRFEERLRFGQVFLCRRHRGRKQNVLIA